MWKDSVEVRLLNVEKAYEQFPWLECYFNKNGCSDAELSGIAPGSLKELSITRDGNCYRVAGSCWWSDSYLTDIDGNLIAIVGDHGYELPKTFWGGVKKSFRVFPERVWDALGRIGQSERERITYLIQRSSEGGKQTLWMYGMDAGYVAKLYDQLGPDWRWEKPLKTGIPVPSLPW